MPVSYCQAVIPYDVKSLFFISYNILESECPCEEKLYDVTVSVDPMKSQNTKEFALYAYENVYNTSEIFMRKQGMNLINFAEQYHFVDPEEPCYFGVVAGGEYALDDGTGIASIADIEFRLQVRLMFLTAFHYIGTAATWRRDVVKCFL